MLNRKSGLFSAGGGFSLDSRVYFKLLLKELNQSFSFSLVDRLHGQQLWSAATKQQFTDVEFVVCGKSFHAHRAIVASRSPHFAKTFNPDEELAKYEIANCDPSTFEQLLFFVYTGILQASADNEDLLLAARRFGIATLQTVCEQALETSFQSVTDDNLLRMSLMMKLPE